MPTTPSGIYYPDTSAADDVPADMMAMADSIVPVFPAASASDAAGRWPGAPAGALATANDNSAATWIKGADGTWRGQTQNLYVSLYKDTTANLASQSWNGFTWAVEADPQNLYDGQTYVTVPVAGWWDLNVQLSLSADTASNTTSRRVQMTKNDTTGGGGNPPGGTSILRTNAAPSGNTTIAARKPVLLAAGDTVRFLYYNGAPTVLAIDAGVDATFWTMRFLGAA